MPPDPRRQAVLVGVGQLRSNRARTLEGAREPADLMADAIGRAVADAGGREVLGKLDRLEIVRSITWNYADLPAEVARRAELVPTSSRHGEVGGNRPVETLDDVARRIADGECETVVVAAGEAMASTAAFGKAGREPPWSRDPGGPWWGTGEGLGFGDQSIAHRLPVPIRAYPFYENRLRADLGQTFADAQRWSAEIYADFSIVAAGNDAAWDPEPRTPAEIATPAAGNRMICHPYPLRMNAHLFVDQAAAVIVTSLARAREIGARPVHVWGGAGGADSSDLLRRVSYGRSPAMGAAFDALFDRAGLTPPDVDAWDLYSCFPVVPKLAALHLKLPRETRLSLTGGLTSFGGPANGYALHAIVAAVRTIRAGARTAFVYGNGELVTKHHAVLLADQPHDEGYVGVGTVTPSAEPVPPVTDRPDGTATLETFTVEYGRDGEPRRGYLIGRTAGGERFAAWTPPGDTATLDRLVDPDREPIGRSGTVSQDADGHNLMTLEDAP